MTPNMTRTLTTQDISWFLDLHRKGQLDLDPPYQRRSVWSPRDKRFFIDSVLNNHPAPAVFLHKTLDNDGIATYHVVDGKQRLTTIIEFTEDKVYIPDDFSVMSLQRKRWKDLEDTTKKQFWNYAIVAEMIPDVSDAVIRNIFDRINRNARTLTRQEIRHAKFDGWFIEFVESECKKQEWAELGVITLARARRMSDVQFISELCAVVIKGTIIGFDQDFLDDLYAEYEEITDLGTFVEDDFVGAIEEIKSILVKLLDLVPKLKNYFKGLGHFYSLWAYLHQEKTNISDVLDFAKRYQSFMASVEQVSSVDEDSVSDQDIIPRGVLDYARNTRGASTDLNPRLKRHHGLEIGVGESGVSSNEDS